MKESNIPPKESAAIRKRHKVFLDMLQSHLDEHRSALKKAVMALEQISREKGDARV